MQKRNINLFVSIGMAAIFCFSLPTGCSTGKEANAPMEHRKATLQKTGFSSLEVPVIQQKTSPAEDQKRPSRILQKRRKMIFSWDVFPLEFTFSSGAGGWGSYLTLHEDGCFEGLFHNSEMAETGDDYEVTFYSCRFSGQFTDIRQIDDNTFSMTLKELTTAEPIGTEWVEDTARYVSFEPVGLTGGTEFLLYLPQTPVSQLSEEFLSWWPYRYLEDSNGFETLSCYGICNMATEEGFFTYE